LRSGIITLDYYTHTWCGRGAVGRLQKICGTGQRIWVDQSETKWHLGFPNIPCRTIT